MHRIAEMRVRAVFWHAAAALLFFALAPNGFCDTARPVHRFLSVLISPDGRNVASVEGDASPSGGEPVIRSLVIRSVDGQRTTTVSLPCGQVRECWPASPAWSPDGRTLAFALRKPGSHAYSVYAVGANGSGLKQLLDFTGTIEDLRYSPRGTLAMLAVANANKEVGPTQAGAAVTGDLGGPIPEQRIAILDGDAIRWASPADMFVYQYDWLPDESGFVGTAAPGDGDNNWWIAKLYRFDAKTGAAHVIFAPRDVRHQINIPVVSGDGRTVAFISGLMSDFGSSGGDVYTVPVAGGAAVDVTPGIQASARRLAWGCDRLLHAQLIAGPATELVQLGDGRAPANAVIEWRGNESISATGAACPSRMMAMSHEDYTTPPEIEVGSIGQWHNLTALNAGITLPAIVRSIAWKSDQFDEQGWLLLPANAKGKLPLITSVHGGPAAAASPGFSGSALQRAELEKGYALFFPNPRGSFGQGEAFTVANVRDLGRGPLRDILAGIDAVERAAPIDDARLAITGGSYGGYMTMFAVTQTDRFKAGVAGAGISDFLSYYGENGIDEWMIPYFGASAYSDPGAYGRESPITYIRNVHTPVFEYVGSNDIECPAAQTQEFWHALHDLGVPTSYAIYPGEGHGIRDPAHIADDQARTLAWFDKYLK